MSATFYIPPTETAQQLLIIWQFQARGPNWQPGQQNPEILAHKTPGSVVKRTREPR